MLTMIRVPVDKMTLKNVAEDFDGYIKFVVDLERSILTAGGRRHVDGEQLLLKDGSKQSNLWGGGLDLKTKAIDFDSMINVRPNDNNPSREVVLPEIREKVMEVVKSLLGLALQ